jgi:hypothetical protein
MRHKFATDNSPLIGTMRTAFYDWQAFDRFAATAT